jgi:hypothetical protein
VLNTRETVIFQNDKSLVVTLPDKIANFNRNVPGHFVVQIISWLWHTRVTSDCAQDSSDGDYSPMILTNTRFRRRPSRLPGQPFRLASKDPLPGAKDFGELGEAVEMAIDHRHQSNSP